MNKSRVVIDTNTLISGILVASSIPDLAIQKARKLATILVSAETIEELQLVMSRSKFDKYVSVKIRSEFVSQLIQESELVEIEESVNVCRDSKDNKFLELAINGKANYLITGDSDLLVLNPFRGVLIITPALFLNN